MLQRHIALTLLLVLQGPVASYAHPSSLMAEAEIATDQWTLSCSNMRIGHSDCLVQRRIGKDPATVTFGGTGITVSYPTSCENRGTWNNVTIKYSGLDNDILLGIQSLMQRHFRGCGQTDQDALFGLASIIAYALRISKYDRIN